MFFTWSMWDENVDSFSSIDCQSPMSERNEEKIGSSDFPSAGAKPVIWLSMERSATVFIVTVFPPAFAPDITTPFIPSPIEKSIGTGFSTSGCLADKRETFSPCIILFAFILIR